jgi:DNA invertase Pin-like site-specific DNA recombinase
MNETRVAIYTRVSTLDQSDGGQEQELREYVERKAWAISSIYQDKVSGLKKVRPELDRLLTDAKKAHFSHVLVWRIDRLGRSVSHLLEVLETFKALGIKFVSLNEAIDTSTPAGMLIFTVLGSVAAFERSILVERVKMGIQNARRRGVRLGRPALANLGTEEIAAMRTQTAESGIHSNSASSSKRIPASFVRLRSWSSGLSAAVPNPTVRSRSVFEP